MEKRTNRSEHLSRCVSEISFLRVSDRKDEKKASRRRSEYGATEFIPGRTAFYRAEISHRK